MNYLPHPTNATTPSRKTRKSDRSKVFVMNRSAKALQKKAKRVARKSLDE